MPFAQHARIIKWTFPTFALILALIWYKRRRIERADPGGKLKANNDTSSVAYVNTSNKEPSKSIAIDKFIPSDSGNHTDESASLPSSTSPPSEASCTPRKVTPNLDIPIRRSNSQPISIKSSKETHCDLSFGAPVNCGRTTPSPKNNRRQNNVVTRINSLPLMESDTGSNAEGPAKVTIVTQAVIEERPDMKERTSPQQKNSANNENLVKKSSVPKRQSITNEDAIMREEELNKIESIPVEADLSKDSSANESIDTINVIIGTHQSKSKFEEASVEANTNKLINDVKNAEPVVERDSANHSPVSGVIEGSVTDEVRSDEGSSDSGKGGSINGGPKDNGHKMYEFRVPSALVGKLIGRHGCFIQHIQNKTGVGAAVKRHPTMKDIKLCQLKGTPEGIASAIEIIKNKFSDEKYANLTQEFVTTDEYKNFENWAVEMATVPLVESMSNDVSICYVVAPNHLFVQIPEHPSYPSLSILDMQMFHWYETMQAPPAPEPLTKGIIVVAKINDRWARVSIEDPDPLGESTLVRLVDHGGYWHVSNTNMRKLKADFAVLPFQAIEVYIANIKPKSMYWTEEAYDIVFRLASGKMAQAQIESYHNNNIHIRLFFQIPTQGYISLAEELITRGLADPTELESLMPNEPCNA